ncbi:MAG: T9SS type A sorting domain-containing protein [Saprospiraceae bacterium]
MKHFILSIFALGVFFQVHAQSPKRTVLVEEFTNASCAPCASFNPKFLPLLEANKADVISLKYQTAFPGFDPMNLVNPGEVLTRQNYYAVNAVPNVFFDGVAKSTSVAQTQAPYTAAIAKAAPYELKVSHEFNKALDSVFVTIEVKNSSTKDYTEKNQVLHVALAEKTITFKTAPGTNGEKVFYDIMHKMVPNASGTPVQEKISIDESVVFKFAVRIPNYFYNLGQFEVIAFVQNKTTKVINQAGKSNIQALTGTFVDLSATNSTLTPSSVCDNGLLPKITVKNLTDSVVTSFDAYYALNGTLSEKLSWTGSLAKNASAIVSFPVVYIPAGTSYLNVSFANVNNGAVQDILMTNNGTLDKIYRTIPAAAEPTTVSLITDFESEPNRTLPKNSILKASNREVPSFTFVCDKSFFNSTVTQPIGGYGQSAKSFIMSLLQMTTKGESSTLHFYKLNLKDSKNTSLKFDYSYIPKLTNGIISNDKFEVLASTDCGKTLKTIFSKAGANLQTGPAVASVTLPTDSQWATAEADLSEFDGKEDVMFMLKATSDVGTFVLIDNINLQAKKGVNVNDILSNSTMEIAPNPAADYTYVNLDLAEATKASVKIFDITGKQIAVLADNQMFGAGAFQLRWDITAAQGNYIVKIETAKGQITKRLTIVK